MKETGRLTRVLLLLLVGLGIMLADRSEAQPSRTFGADSWLVYGTSYTHDRDDTVPGQSVLAVQPRGQSGEPWSSGAGMAIPYAIPAGERVTAVLWARAARPMRLTVGLQGSAPAYARFAAAEVTLTTEWQQVSVSGVAPTDFAANSQSLSVQLGQTGVEVRLGPTAFLRGPADRATVARAFGVFRPTEFTTDVRIASEPGIVLAGTLHMPAGHGHAPFPLAVLIQGHGPNGRFGFTEIVKRLTADGIAALEYDKRGVGQSTGTYKEDGERLTADAAAAVAAMRRRTDIDGSRIALIGHSQGGAIAPAVAAADPTIAAVVTLAGPVGDGLPFLGRAIHNQMIVAGRPEAAVAPAVAAVTTLLQARIDGWDDSTIAPLRAAVIDRFEAAGFSRSEAEGGLAMIDTEEARHVDKFRSASDLKALHMPVLAVYGTKDPMVLASDQAVAARAMLANNPRGRVVVLDGLSHWFQEGAKTGTEEEVSRLGPNLGSPRIVSLVGDWVSDALKPRRAVARGQPRSRVCAALVRRSASCA